MKIDGKSIGSGSEPYVICELSGNHNGSLERMLEMIVAAKETGADAIKIQSYTADTITIDHDGPEFFIEGGLWDGQKLHDLYQDAGTPWEWHEAMFDKAREIGITLFSTPFDFTAVDLLESLKAPAYKIASFEIIDIPLIKYVASKGKPMIISTGMANLAEIEDAVAAAREAGCKDLCLLHCISSYPAPIEEANIATVAHLGEAFDVPSGLSDHTMGIAASVASCALGGSLIEKHFTLARADGGPDAAFSLEPDEFKQLVTECKNASKSIGKVGYDFKGSERGNTVFRRSLYCVADIKAGEKFTEKNVRSIRPGNGLPPKMLSQIIGKTARHEIKFGAPMSMDMISNSSESQNTK